MPSYAPFYDPKARHFEKNSVSELTKAYVWSLNSTSCVNLFVIVCSTARTYSLHATLTLGKPLVVATINRLSPLLSRYLTAATIFRGNISSREVSDLEALSKDMMTFVLFSQAEVCPFVVMLFPICGLLNIIAVVARCVARSQYMTFKWKTRNTLWSMCNFFWMNWVTTNFSIMSWRWIPDNVSVSLVRVPPVGQTQVYWHTFIGL